MNNRLKEVEIEINGKVYKGMYKLNKEIIQVWYLNSKKTTQLGGLNEETLAKMLLSELVRQNEK